MAKTCRMGRNVALAPEENPSWPARLVEMTESEPTVFKFWESIVEIRGSLPSGVLYVLRYLSQKEASRCRGPH